MSQFPHLPLFTDAYIADTAHLTCEQHGAYLRLLMFAWRTRDCELAADDARLALMVGLPVKRWLRIKPEIMAFWTLSEGFWSPNRIHFGPTPRTSIAPSIRRQILASARCVYCSDADGPFEVDHVIPLSRGGSNQESNMACACKACNRSKRAMMLSEWLQ